MTSEDQKDCERYKKHVETIQRAFEIINGDEPQPIKKLLLEQIGCDPLTYGDIVEVRGKPYTQKVHSDVKLLWTLGVEMKSFKHAIQKLEER